MSHRYRTFIVASIVALGLHLPTEVAAQDPADCDRLTLTTREPIDTKQSTDSAAVDRRNKLLSDIDGCATQVIAAIEVRVTALEAKDLTPDKREELHRQLQTLHQNFHRIADWANVLMDKELPASATALEVAVKKRVLEGEVTIHDALADKGLRNHFLLTLVPGASTSIGGEGQSSSLSTSPVTYLEMQSRHVPRRGRYDFGVGGRLGILPGTVVKDDSEDTETEATATITNVQQAMFTSTLWVEGSRRTSDESELFVRLSLGATALLKKDTVALKDDKVYLFTPVGTSGDNPKTHHEVGLYWRYFNNTLEDVHELQKFSTPAFLAGISYRNDRRLAAVGPLAEFAKPQRRLIFSLGLHDIPVYGASGSDRVSFNLGLEYESALPNFLLSTADEKKAKLPSSMRLLIGGTLDLTPLFGG